MSAWRCDLCGGSRQEPHSPWLLRCLDCGLVASHPQPDPAQLQDRYGSDYYSGWHGGGHRKRLWSRRLQIVRRWVRDGRLLDVGCGAGEFLRVASQCGFKPVGTEFSEAARASIRDFEIVRTPETAPGEFDIATLWHVLEHMPSPNQSLAVVRSKLRSKGWLFIAVPNLESRWFDAVYRAVKGKAPELYSPDSKEPHLFHFSESTLRRLLEKNGFEVLATSPDVPDADWRYRLADWPARLWFHLRGINRTLTLMAVARKRE